MNGNIQRLYTYHFRTFRLNNQSLYIIEIWDQDKVFHIDNIKVINDQDFDDWVVGLT